LGYDKEEIFFFCVHATVEKGLSDPPDLLVFLSCPSGRDDDRIHYKNQIFESLVRTFLFCVHEFMGLTSELRGMCDFWPNFVWAFCSRGKVNKVVTSIIFLLKRGSQNVSKVSPWKTS